MEENSIFFADGNDPKIMEAYKKAQETFKYFWREQSWEYRRVIPGLNVACVKTTFEEQDEETGKSIVEHMWINDVLFDGENIKGTLINEPGSLKNIQVGDYVEIPLHHLTDWLFAITPSVQKPKGLSRLFSSSSPELPRAYGGFTIQKMRADMSDAERKEHDNAWQLDFGDFNEILVVNNQKESPENLVEHPMSKNMKEEFVKFLQQYPDEILHVDENGLTLLHREAIAGNLTIVQAALDAGADKSIRSEKGKTALDYAKEFQWKHIIPVLEG